MSSDSLLAFWRLGVKFYGIIPKKFAILTKFWIQFRANWFPGFGISLHNYRLIKQLSVSVTGHFWQQPENFDFNTADSFTGGAINVDFSYFFFSKHALLDAFSVDFGLIDKSKGFLPEELYLDKHFGVRLGSTIRL